MKLSVEVKRILEDLKEQNGQDPIDADSALILYGGEPSTFNQLTLTQKLQYAVIVVSANRDALAEAYTSLAEKHNEALAVIGKLHGNRAQRRMNGR